MGVRRRRTLQQVTTDLKEFIARCERDPDRAEADLASGKTEKWFGDRGIPSIATLAREARESRGNDRTRLRAFLRPLRNPMLLMKRFEPAIIEAKRQPLSFLLVGRTGVGKTSTINALLGQEKGRVGKFRVATRNVKGYRANVEGVQYLMYDTPGLADATGSTRSYIQSIRQDVRQVDCVWFVTILNERRLRDDEVAAIKTITEAFGTTIWRRSLIIFTHADLVRPHNYQEHMEERTKIVRGAIAKHAGRSIAAAIPSLAVATDEDTGEPLPTPDGEEWMGELFVKVFARIAPHAALPFVLSNARRLRTAPARPRAVKGGRSPSDRKTIYLNRTQQTEIRSVAKSIDFGDDFGDVVQGAALGASLGFGIGGPVGAAAGAVLAGAFALLFGD